MKIYITSILLVVFYSFTFAQCNYTLKGKVIDHHDRTPLEFAEIFIKDLNKGALTDSAGNYLIKDLCNGMYLITVKHLGCEDIMTTVTITGNTIQNFYPEHHLHELGLVNVVTQKEKEKSVVTSIELKGKELEQRKGLSLGEVMKTITGVNTIQTGATISKPVIHGLHSNRILILNNGIRQEGQQWGNEHAPEIDPFIANRISVIKGASTVRYGADAIGGVILVEPNELRDSAGIGGEYNVVGFTNGKGAATSIMLEQNFKKIPAFSWRLQGTLKKAGNVKTPNYFLKNSGIEEYNFSAAAGWKKENYGTEIFYSQFNTTLGIFSGAHIGNVTDLQNAINSSKPFVISGFSYAIDRPKQHIEHELLKAKAYIKTGEKGKLNFIYARQYNLRNEFDTHVSNNSTKPQLHFEITTHTGEISFEHNSIKRFTGVFGISGILQGNTYEGRYFIPNFRSQTIGGFAIERFTINKLIVEAGVRYDFRYMQIFKYEKNVIISPEHQFSNTSATLGFIYKWGNVLQLNLNAANAWRAPNVNEMYSKGVHHGAATYEIGNAQLQTEKSYNINAGFNYNKNKWKADASVYYNLIDDFIYLKPQLPPTVTIAGAFPTFVFSQTSAALYGLDAQLEYLLLPQILVSAKTSLLRAKDRNAGNYLIQMPADRHSVELTYNLKSNKLFSDTYVSASVQYENKQWRVPSNSDYMNPPDAYYLLNCELGTTIKLGNQQIIMGITGMNLLNTVYRNYMNRFRYYSDEMGRNVLVRIKIPFNKSINNN